MEHTVLAQYTDTRRTSILYDSIHSMNVLSCDCEKCITPWLTDSFEDNTHTQEEYLTYIICITGNYQECPTESRVNELFKCKGHQESSRNRENIETFDWVNNGVILIANKIVRTTFVSSLLSCIPSWQRSKEMYAIMKYHIKLCILPTLQYILVYL